ncbi:MAG TPA: STAS domain-containing protein [Polyangiaceae bacterium]|nr:STAS domain-containing protein [Polyangiaceae bacterium]
MTIASTREGIFCRIEVHGRFDFSCRADFRTAYTAASRGTKFIVDMTSVDYVDSAALGMLLLLRDHAGGAENVVISGCKGQPDQVLKIANFHKIFRFE